MPNDTLPERIQQSRDILDDLLRKYNKVVCANSLGAEDMVIMDLLRKHHPNISLFTLDTGRLPSETYDLMQAIQQHYNYKLKIYYPDTDAIEEYTQTHGINAFYESIDLRKACCHIRKVQPLTRALKGQEAWIVGLRRAQSITREEVAPLSYDQNFGLYKCSPLADWSEENVWDYIRQNDVPYNTLHDQHYPSIGCAPCSRAITVGEDIRAGRWWWENPETKECGLHPVSALK